MGAPMGYPPQPVPTPPNPRSRRNLWITLGAAGGGLVLLCVILAVIGAIVGPQTKPVADASAGTTRTSAAGPTTQPTSHAAAPPPASVHPSPTPKATTATPTQDPNRRICSFTSAGGVYYLYVTSATDHNFKACNGGTPFAGTIDDLFQQPNMDRRCILGPAATAANDAIVGVYSDTKQANLAAAKSYCATNGGTESG